MDKDKFNNDIKPDNLECEQIKKVDSDNIQSTQRPPRPTDRSEESGPPPFRPPIMEPPGRPGRPEPPPFRPPIMEPPGRPGRPGPPPFRPPVMGPPSIPGRPGPPPFGPPIMGPPSIVPQLPRGMVIPLQGSAEFNALFGNINRINDLELQFRRCLNRFTFVWLWSGRSFWFYPTFIGRRSAEGFIWSRGGWFYYRLNLDRIFFFRCF